MNKSLALLGHALRMLILDVSSLLRVLAPALALLAVGIIGLIWAAPTFPHLSTGLTEAPTPNAGGMLAGVVFAVITAMGFVLLAVLWHRHVLIDAQNAPPGRPSARIVLSYLMRTILIGAIQLAVTVPLLILLFLAAPRMNVVAGEAPTVVIFGALGILAGLLFIWVALRLGLMLPAAAVGRPMGPLESWRHTAPAGTALIWLALLLLTANAVLSTLSALTGAPGSGIRVAVEAVVYILEALVFVSVLTTLYGHYVERRDIG